MLQFPGREVEASFEKIEHDMKTVHEASTSGTEALFGNGLLF